MFKGLYINLDRKPDRRRRMEAEFGRYKLRNRYERVSAVDGYPGRIGGEAAAIGCFLSHLKTMRIAAKAGTMVHILEDDVILSSRLTPFLASRECAEAVAKYDLVFLDTWVNPALAQRYQQALASAGSGLTLMNMRGMEIAAADSYVVGPRSVKKVLSFLEREAAHQPPRMAVDVFYRISVDSGVLTAAVVLPFLTCIDIETGSESTIQELQREDQRRYVMLRTAFFAERERQPSLVVPQPDGGGA